MEAVPSALAKIATVGRLFVVAKIMGRVQAVKIAYKYKRVRWSMDAKHRQPGYRAAHLPPALRLEIAQILWRRAQGRTPERQGQPQPIVARDKIKI